MAPVSHSGYALHRPPEAFNHHSGALHRPHGGIQPNRMWGETHRASRRTTLLRYFPDLHFGQWSDGPLCGSSWTSAPRGYPMAPPPQPRRRTRYSQPWSESVGAPHRMTTVTNSFVRCSVSFRTQLGQPCVELDAVRNVALQHKQCNQRFHHRNHQCSPSARCLVRRVEKWEHSSPARAGASRRTPTIMLQVLREQERTLERDS